MDDNKQPVELNEEELESEPTREETIDLEKKMLAIYKATNKATEKENPDHYKKFKKFFEMRVAETITIISVLEVLDDSEFEEYKKLCVTPTKEDYEKFMEFIEKKKKQKGLVDTLPILQSKCPKYHAMSIQKLATELQHELINAGGVDLIVANKGKKNEITSYVLATYEEVNGIINWTEFDRQVHDAVSSLWEYGHESHIITPDMVARTMNHRTETEKVSPQFKDAVAKSLEKMRRIHITLNASEEIRKRKITLDGKTVTSFKVDDYLLSLKGIEVKAGGKTVKGYLMQSEPLLLTYAKMTKQLSTIPAYLLDIKEVDKAGKVTTVSIKSNENRVSVNGYLLRRIAIMQRDRKNKKPKQSNIILFETLFEETGIPQDSNAKRVKDYVFQVLDYFTAGGYIKGYTKRKSKGKGGGIDAVIIDL